MYNLPPCRDLPNPYCVSSTWGRDEFPPRVPGNRTGPGHSRTGAVWLDGGPQYEEFLAGLRVPNPHVRVREDGERQSPAVGAPGDRTANVPGYLQHDRVAVPVRVPHLHALRAPGSQPPSVRTPRHGTDRPRMPTEGKVILGSRRIPDLDRQSNVD